MRECHEHDAPVGDASCFRPSHASLFALDHLSKTTESIIATYCLNHVTIQADVRPKEFCLFSSTLGMQGTLR